MTATDKSSTNPAAARARARRGDGDRLREEILDAAERLLVEVGNVDSVSVRQIAKAVGCTPPALYLHFTDKDELVFHVCCRRFEEFHATLLAAIDGLEDPAEQMLAMGRAYVAFGVERPEAYRVLFSIKPDDVIPDGVDRDQLPGMLAFGVLFDTVVRGIERGEFHAPDPLAASIGIWATMHGLVDVLSSHTDGLFELPADLVDQVCRQTLDGLRVR